MMTFELYQPNPLGKNVGDCAVRAIAAATNQDWNGAYISLCIEGLCMKNLPHANEVFGSYLRHCGFVKKSLPDSCVDSYTVADFIEDHPNGVYVLCLSSHVVCVRDGALMDSWDSSNEIVIYYFAREDD